MVAYIPEILWAQRSSATDESKNIVYLTVNIIDSEKPKLKLTSTSLSFDSKSDDDNNEYKFGIDFYEEINVEKSREHQTGRGVFFVLQKTTKKAEYWPRLTKEKKKFPYIKTDFDKWVDEDEQDKPETEDDYGFGGAPGGDYGFGGAPGGTPTGLDSLDFSQLAGGFPGLGGGKGMPDLSALGGLGGGADEEAGEASADASEQAEEAKDAEEAKEAESK